MTLKASQPGRLPGQGNTAGVKVGQPAPPGTAWHNLAQPGTTWHNLAQPGRTVTLKAAGMRPEGAAPVEASPWVARQPGLAQAGLAWPATWPAGLAANTTFNPERLRTTDKSEDRLVLGPDSLNAITALNRRGKKTKVKRTAAPEIEGNILQKAKTTSELVPHYGLLHCYVHLFFRQYLELWLSTLPPSCPFDSYQFVDVVDYIRHLTDSHYYTAIKVEVGEMVHWKAGLAGCKCPHCVMKFPVRTLESGRRDLGKLVEHCGLLHNFYLYYLQQGYPPAGVKLEVTQETEELEPPLVWSGTSVMQSGGKMLVLVLVIMNNYLQAEEAEDHDGVHLHDDIHVAMPVQLQDGQLHHPGVASDDSDIANGDKKEKKEKEEKDEMQHGDNANTDVAAAECCSSSDVATAVIATKKWQGGRTRK